METINTPIADIHFNKADNILHIKIREGAEMNLNNTLTHYNQINTLVNNQNYLALVEASNSYVVEKAAWEYASMEAVVSNRKAVAHYNSCFSNRLTTSFFKSAYKTRMPVEIFNTKEEATAWLLTFAS